MSVSLAAAPALPLHTAGPYVAAAPALPLHTAGPYVAAAYIVFVVLLLVYLAIIGGRTSRTERQLKALRAELRARADGHSDSAAGDTTTVQDHERVAV